MMGMTRVANSPFLLVAVYQPEVLLQKWSFLLIQVIIAVIFSVVVIFLVTWWGSTTLVSRIYEADNRRAAVLHEIEYTNKMAHIGRLAAGVAHEINNPMAIINEKVGLMKDLLALSADFPRREKFLHQVEKISNSVKRVSDITHRLLGFARHLPVLTDKIHIGLLIKEVLGFVGREAEHRNISINLDIPPESPVIESDQGQLQQVFLNIINNALGAVKEGGRIDISISQDSSESVAVSIADNGVGIPPEHLKSIFEPFFSTKGKRGTGLGLSITYGIVQKLGGRISVESEEGVGTTFCVVLPLRQAAQRT
ncbi:MAG: ATP-binding protein [Deltaproteobacteria bacterium]|nr:ATP-binding protein [Deltaproteobacteria bacterium]